MMWKIYPKNVPPVSGKKYLVWRKDNANGHYSTDVYYHVSPFYDKNPSTQDKHWKYAYPDTIMAWTELPPPFQRK
jgi:hypothetical protein